jgi:hypothetical protein
MVNTMPSTAAARSDRALAARLPHNAPVSAQISAPGSPPHRPAISLRLNVDYVDVRHATVLPVRIWLEGDLLQVDGRGLLRQVPMSQIDWQQARHPEPRRAARLPDGSALCANNLQEWDAWCQRVLHADHTPIRHHRVPRLWGSVAVGLAMVMLAVWAMP